MATPMAAANNEPGRLSLLFRARLAFVVLAALALELPVADEVLDF